MPRIALAAAIEEVAARDRTFARLVATVGPIRFLPRTPDGPFGMLVRAICSQQISAASAQAIIGRLAAAMGGLFTPEALAEASDEVMREAGLSRNKMVSLRDLSAKVLDGTVDVSPSTRQTDEEIIERLTTVRGIGRWSAEMYLMHCLRRLDVWPAGDLDVREGYARTWQVDPRPTERELLPLGDPFRPYRSVVARYCQEAVFLDLRS
ncbi:DNA-3-methyladenine glycosylase II [Asanoa hainanensis]|uniref:DNA-3-methyladenine glycosylase II n=1 Tax=Asanoa hainanensis TaxID=560556 RepID=A0A239NHT9_9ACTN|nr:DNA-3-methyladenine glycosylase [Asanoa hainanensis]SNT54456.1 DNA-3-methyladenine glycosylase II [Asanoa hainanensis]